MKRIEIRHLTRYRFGAEVRLGPHSLLLRPRDGHDLRVAASVLDITPGCQVTWRRDLYDNVLAEAQLDGLVTTELVIESRVQVELYEMAPLDFVVQEHALRFPFNYQPEERAALVPFRETVYPADPRLAGWLRPYRSPGPRTETFLVLERLNQRIHDELEYRVREEEGVQPPGRTLELGAGSCRDLAALFVEACRRLGIAARFVSGYIHGPATEAGGGTTHAWAEVYLPGAGWKGFDPTHASLVGPDHVPVAVHRHPESVPPVAGTFTGPAGLRPQLQVDVRIREECGA